MVHARTRALRSAHPLRKGERRSPGANRLLFTAIRVACQLQARIEILRRSPPAKAGFFVCLGRHLYRQFLLALTTGGTGDYWEGALLTNKVGDERLEVVGERDTTGIRCQADLVANRWRDSPLQQHGRNVLRTSTAVRLSTHGLHFGARMHTREPRARRVAERNPIGVVRVPVRGTSGVGGLAWDKW